MINFPTDPPCTQLDVERLTQKLLATDLETESFVAAVERLFRDADYSDRRERLTVENVGSENWGPIVASLLRTLWEAAKLRELESVR